MAITKLVISGADSKTISLAHKAESTSVVPDDNITATNVQSALEQLDDIKAQASNGTLSNPTFTGTVTASSLTVDTDTLYVDATNDRVGIGTTSPATALDVTGSLTISSATANVADLRRANNTGAGQVLLGNSDGYARLSDTNGSFDIFNSGNTAQRFGIANNGDISFYEDTGATAKLFWDASAESLGIGTTSPDGILHAHKANAGADTAIMLENSGQSGTSTASLVFTGNGGAGQEKARIKSAVYGDGYMAFHTNDDTEKMRIDASGHVLVGTSSSAGDATNVKKVVGGVFTTLRDSLSVANNTATTVATLPSGEGNYMVSASLDNSNNPAHYNETAMVGVSQSSSAITVLKNASHLTLSMSGLNLQVTHNQGATQTIHFSILRIL